MDNYFQNIYKPYLRTAEKVDTRTAIQQHQKQNRRDRENQERPEKPGTLFGDDQMVVSLISLTGLLEDLLHLKQTTGEDAESEENPEETEKEDQDQDANTPDKRDSTQSLAGRNAANAYQQAAATGGVKQAPPTDPEDYNAAGIPAEEIDQDRIQSLLDKTRELQNRGHEEINIIDRGDFLQSLERTVDEILIQK